MIHQAGRWLAEAAKGRAPVLGVDDAQLLDDASAALVYHLAATGAAFVVATVRSGEPAPGPITALWKDGLGERIEVQPLGRSGTSALIEALLGGPADAVTREQLWRLSQGNALYLRELVRGGLASAALTSRDGVWCWLGDVSAAPRLVELIATRVADQPPAVQALVDLVAFGEPLGVALLGRAGVSPVTIEAGEHAGLLRTEPFRRDISVWLAHPMFGEAARRGASVLHRREVCRQLADAAGAGEAGDDPVRIAVWHLDGGIVPEPAILVAAARRALAAADLPLTQRLAAAAVEAGGGVEAESVLATAHMLCGDAGQAETLLAGLTQRELPDAVRAELAAARAWNLTFALGLPAAAEDVLVAAERVVTVGWELLACQRANLLGYAGRPAEAVAVAATVTQSPAADPEATVRALTLTCQSLSVLGRLEDSLRAGERALELHQQLRGTDWSMSREETLGGMAGVSVFAGRLDEAQALVDTGRDLSTAAGWMVGAAMWTTWQGDVALARGCPATALRHLREATALNEAGAHPYSRYLTQLLWLLRARASALLGEVVEATTALRLAEPLARPWTGVLDVWGGSSEAWVAVARGEITAGIELALSAAQRAQRDQQFGWEIIALHQVVRFGAPERVTGRLAELGSFVDGLLAALYVQHALALARADGGALDGVASSFADLGYLLLAADAAAHAARAHRQAGHLGSAGAATARARELAARCEGARTPALALLTDASGLTRRETEIARLAASGLTNRDIAEKLVISVRTVDNTLHQIYSKLTITSRADLTPLFNTSTPPPSR
jgi:DNA-binding CsgD family transcriptional regulator